MSLGHLKTREGDLGMDPATSTWMGICLNVKLLGEKHPSQSLVTGLQEKPIEQKTDISLDFLTLGLLTPQAGDSCKGSSAHLSAPTAVAPSRTCRWLRLLARAEGRAGALVPICTNLLALLSPQHHGPDSHVLQLCPPGSKGPEKKWLEFCVILCNQHFKANSLEKAVCSLPSWISL